ncbi:MAG TPA: cytochrome P450 [Amycolatopsis sp.]|nr:cytochrome P450 [Amycolatopsis sp.]
MSSSTDSTIPALTSTAGTEPFQYFDRLRSADPVHWDESMQAWVVTDYTLAKGVMREDKKSFRHPFADMMTEAMIAIEGGPRARNFQHGETHGRMHRWLLSQFHARKVDEWRTTLIRPILDELIARFAADGHVEIMRQLADPFPVRVIAAVMDLPWRDDGWIAECKRLMDAKLEYLQHQGQHEDPDLAARTIKAMNDLNDLVRPFVDARRDGTGSDFISETWKAGTTLIPDWNDTDTLGMVTGMFFAGSDTTMHTISNAFHVLLHDPALMARLRTEGTPAVERFTEEILRLHGAVQFRLRKANEDTEVGGVPIKKDQTVLNLHAAANRDPAVWGTEAGTVNLDREGPLRPRDHLAFSFGPRTCAGAALARAEIQEAVAAMLRWFPDLALDESADRPEYSGFALRSYAPVSAVFAPVATGA